MIGLISVLKSDWLGLAGSGEDARVTRALEAASRDIATICRQPIEATTTVLQITGNGRTHYPISRYTVPVTVTLVQTRSTPVESWQTSSQVVTAYEVNGVWHLYSEAGFMQNEYRITMTVGYSSVPLDIQQAAYKLAKEYYLQFGNRADTDRFAVTSVSIGNGVDTVSKQIKNMREQVALDLFAYRSLQP